MMIDSLGSRICIMGPSNSGKSTLAAAIGRARGLTPIHLDTLYHLPNSDWQARPSEAFIASHDAAIAGERWVMDGNYTRCLPQRLARDTGFILLDTSPRPACSDICVDAGSNVIVMAGWKAAKIVSNGI